MRDRSKLEEIDLKLNALIANATRLRECEEDQEDGSQLKNEQDALLQELLDLNQNLSSVEKEALCKTTPRLYKKIESKIFNFSELNFRLIKASRASLQCRRFSHRKPQLYL